MYLNVIACHHQISQNFAWVEQSPPRTVGFSAKSSELHRGPIWYVPCPFRKSIASVESEWRTHVPMFFLLWIVVNVLWFVVAHGSTNIMDPTSNPTWSMLTSSDFWGSEAISSDHFFGSDIEVESSTDERKQRSKISKLGTPDQIFFSDQISDGFSNVS